MITTADIILTRLLKKKKTNPDDNGQRWTMTIEDTILIPLTNMTVATTPIMKNMILTRLIKMQDLQFQDFIFDIFT